MARKTKRLSGVLAAVDRASNQVAKWPKWKRSIGMADNKTIKVKKECWEEFRKTGLLWLVNTTLHVFGWVIVVEYDDDGNPVDAWPSKTSWRGFDPKLNDENYARLEGYLRGKYGDDNA